jgi:hypothetical protein
MWGSGPTDVWASGRLGTVMHFDGSGWSAESLGLDRLYALAGWSEGQDAAWIVDPAAGMLRWDGSSWRPSQAALPDDPYRYLSMGRPSFGISSAGDVAWAWGLPPPAGAMGWFDGARWNVIAAPGDPVQLWAAGADDVFALLVNASTDPTLPPPYSVGRYRAGTWEIQPIGPGPISGTGPDDVWVTSGLTDSVWHFDGSQWTPQGVSSSQTVFAAAPGDAWAGDLHLANGTWSEVQGTPATFAWASGARDVWGADLAGTQWWGNTGSDLAHWDGSQWARQGFLTGTLRVLGQASPDEAWGIALGSEGQVLVRWDGTDWSQVPGSRLSSDVISWPSQGTTASYGTSASDLWLVSVELWTEPPTLLHWNGAAWTSFDFPWSAPGPGSRVAMAGSGAADVWFLTPGNLDHWDGMGWTAVDLPPDAISAIWAPGPGVLLALTYRFSTQVGSPEVPHQDILWRWEKGHWSEALVGASDVCTWAPRCIFGSEGALWGSGPNDIWASLNATYHWDGQSWTTVTGAPAGMTCLWGTGPSDVWGYPAYGFPSSPPSELYHWDGQAWSVLGSPEPFFCGAGDWIQTTLGGLWRRDEAHGR